MGVRQQLGVYATVPTQTVRTKKIPKNWVKAEATDKHPAQVEIFHEDVIVGTWTTIKFSGAVPSMRVNELLTRVDRLVEAVKFARGRRTARRSSTGLSAALSSATSSRSRHKFPASAGKQSTS